MLRIGCKIMLKKILIILTLIFWASNCLAQELPAQSKPKPKRYISLAPATTEILFALGLEDQIAGVSQFCDYPYSVILKEKIGTFSEPNIEKIISLKPDIIFCAGLEQASVVKKLQELGLTVCVSDPNTIEELLTSIREIGELTGKEGEAQDLTDNMQKAIQQIAFETKFRTNKPKVFVEIYSSPLMTAGKNSILGELVTIAGGENIAENVKRPYSIFTSEEVIRANPDCIVLTYMDSKNPAGLVGRRLGWSALAAVKNNRVYNDIDPNTLIRPGPRIVEGLKELKNKFHPKK